jgi:hypothetical protein
MHKMRAEDWARLARLARLAAEDWAATDTSRRRAQREAVEAASLTAAYASCIADRLAVAQERRAPAGIIGEETGDERY